MSYYIAKDRFGQLDLCHYGVKGMKWGEQKAEEFNSAARSTAAIVKAQAQGMKRTAQLKGTSGTNYSSGSSNGSQASSAQSQGVSQKNVEAINKAVGNMPVPPEEPKNMEDIPVTVEEKKLDEQISDANTKYQTELMRMQLIARAALSNGVTPTADPEYISARKSVVKAKYELDQLKLKQQEEAAKNPPTYAEAKERVDSQAKEQLKEDKAKETKKKSSGMSMVDTHVFNPNRSYSGRK